MKKIGFIVYRNLIKYDLFKKAAEEIGVELNIIPHPELSYQFLNSKNKISWKKEGLEKFDAIYLRSAQNKPEQASLIAQYCLDKNIPLCDRAFIQSAPWIDRKSFECIRLAKKDLPIIDSIWINQAQINEVEAQIGFPCVAKETDSSQGKGVYLIKNQPELETLLKRLEKRLLVQKFIENTGDYRFFVIGDKLLAAIKRVRKRSDEFLNNISHGAEAEPYQAKTSEADLAVKAAQTMGYDIAGVDLIKDKGEMKIMEVNRSPGYSGLMNAAGINVPLKILEYVVSLAKD